MIKVSRRKSTPRRAAVTFTMNEDDLRALERMVSAGYITLSERGIGDSRQADSLAENKRVMAEWCHALDHS